jgi:hypothetical protein
MGLDSGTPEGREVWIWSYLIPPNHSSLVSAHPTPIFPNFLKNYSSICKSQQKWFYFYFFVGWVCNYKTLFFFLSTILRVGEKKIECSRTILTLFFSKTVAPDLPGEALYIRVSCASVTRGCGQFLRVLGSRWRNRNLGVLPVRDPTLICTRIQNMK